MIRLGFSRRAVLTLGLVVAVQHLRLQGQLETMADLKIATHVPLAVR